MGQEEKENKCIASEGYLCVLPLYSYITELD